MKEMRWLDPSGTSSSVVNMKHFISGIKIKKANDRHKGILKYMTKEVDIPTED